MKLEQLTKFLNDIESGTVRGHEKDKKLHDCVVRLSTMGWALPGSLTFEQIETLAAADVPSEEIDELLVDYYTRDQCERLESLLSASFSSALLEMYKDLLEEALSSFKDERYRICVPSLITVVEGVLTSRLGLRDSKDIRVISPTKKIIEDEKMNLGKTYWSSVHSLIDSLFVISNFDEQMPGKLNRHWVLHGRAELGESKKNALQLFVLIATINAA